MAHPLSISKHVANTDAECLSILDEEATHQSRVDLAACFRTAANLGMQEGICNHFSAMVPGSDNLFLVNPYGLAFDEVTASSLLVCNLQGRVVKGVGKPEATAFYIHARIHMKHPHARVILHTHMPNATSFCLTEGEPFLWASQTSLKFWGRVAVDESYNGLALDESEGDRIASTIGNANVVFLKNHGVMVIGPTIAEAWDDLYYLERAAEVQRMAMSTGRALKGIDSTIAAQTAAQIRAGDSESANAHLESIKRRLMTMDPEFSL